MSIKPYPIYLIDMGLEQGWFPFAVKLAAPNPPQEWVFRADRWVKSMKDSADRKIIILDWGRGNGILEAVNKIIPWYIR